MGNLDRRISPERSGEACAVCGATDKRTLSYTRLSDGERITVCGSHKVAHRRADALASTVEELVSMIGDRRKKTG
jgi:hypothetical protein